MGRLLRENPANSQLLRGGRRAGTLRSRVRVVLKFLSWLALAHNLAYPAHWRHLIECMQVRLSEPCVRGSLKLIHLSYIFMQEVAGVDDRLTDAALFDVTKRELPASAFPGKPPRQAPHFLVIILAALEDNVVSLDTPIFLRVLSWWMLLQSWATLRFDDHRGMVPSDLKVSETGLVGKLTRSKVSGPDKKLKLPAPRRSQFSLHSFTTRNGWYQDGKSWRKKRRISRVPPSCTLEQLSGIYKEGIEISSCFWDSDQDHLIALLLWTKAFPSEHWTLQYSP